MVFTQHDMIHGSSFNQFHLISCRNALIYFDNADQEKVFELFYNSLTPNGHLLLGSKETLAYSKFANKFEPVCLTSRIYKKV